MPGRGEPPYLAQLNPEQRAAVETLDGPLLVLAGAGTGKTRVLTCRIAHLIDSSRAHPGEILAVTFTNKAAAEMAARVERLIARPVAGMALGTFHAISARWLRRYAEQAGRKPDFTILDTDDQERLIRQLLAEADIDAKQWPARLLAQLIDRWKNRGLPPESVPEDEAASFAHGRGGELYAAYEERLRALNAIDFGGLILEMITLMREQAELRAALKQRYRYILVDEYQDTNAAQYLWLRLLADADGNLCCVGDEDQSIYGWRGAEIGNILRFERDFPAAKVIRLERNYRSTGHILGAASSLIAANRSRLGKTLKSQGEAGEKVRVIAVWDGEEEARVVTDLIEAEQRAGLALGEIAILVRAGFQTRPFEERLIQLGLPYRVVGGPRFYERQEIRDALAYLRVIANPDDDLAFERIINVPRRGIGEATLRRLRRFARRARLPLFSAALKMVETDELRPAVRGALARLSEQFLRWREDAAHIPHTELAGRVLEESGYVAMWQAARTADAPGRLENLAELVRAMAEFENLQGFLEHISLVMENEAAAEADKISLMTLHAAKGLEFHSVYLPGWEEGVFPNQRTLDEGGEKALEEERRLAYVGLTRARRRAVILHAASRMVFGQWQSMIPSRFIEEIEPAHLERHHLPGMAAAAGRDPALAGAYQGYDVELKRGPGWQRTRRRRMAARLERESRPRLAAAGPAPRFAVGERVFHQKFGYGEVVEVEDEKLVVRFDTSGLKHVIAHFLEPAA